MRAEFDGPSTLSASIYDVGYEILPDTVVDVPGPIPEPGTLGMLALGAAALAVLRRKSWSR